MGGAAGELRGRKMLAMTENGPLPDAEGMRGLQARWLWFCTWPGGLILDGKSNTAEAIGKVFGDADVVTEEGWEGGDGGTAASPPAPLPAGEGGRRNGGRAGNCSYAQSVGPGGSGGAAGGLVDGLDVFGALVQLHQLAEFVALRLLLGPLAQVAQSHGFAGGADAAAAVHVCNRRTQ